jgi:hypothetical protein
MPARRRKPAPDLSTWANSIAGPPRPVALAVPPSMQVERDFAAAVSLLERGHRGPDVAERLRRVAEHHPIPDVRRLAKAVLGVCTRDNPEDE